MSAPPKPPPAVLIWALWLRSIDQLIRGVHPHHGGAPFSVGLPSGCIEGWVREVCEPPHHHGAMLAILHGYSQLPSPFHVSPLLPEGPA